MACAIHGVSALCDQTCAGFIHGTSASEQPPAQPPTFDAETAGPPFADYQQLQAAWKAQHAPNEPPTEQYAREQGWLADEGAGAADNGEGAGASE